MEDRRAEGMQSIPDGNGSITFHGSPSFGTINPPNGSSVAMGGTLQNPAIDGGAGYAFGIDAGGNVAEINLRSKIRDISVQELDKGFVVKVGCQTVAIGSKKKLIKLLTQYIENPAETESLYHQGKLI